MRRWLFADLNSTLGDVSSTLGDISSTLGDVRSTLGDVVGRLDRIDDNTKQSLAAIHNLQQVNREIVLELQAHRPILEAIDRGVHANTEGLLHVLDELRGGPGTAPAA